MCGYFAVAVFRHMRCSGGDAKERYKCVDSRAPQLVRAINMFEDFLDFFFSRSFLIVLLLTALFPTRFARLILSESPISSSLLLQNQKKMSYTKPELQNICSKAVMAQKK